MWCIETAKIENRVGGQKMDDNRRNNKIYNALKGEGTKRGRIGQKVKELKVQDVK